MKQMMFYHITTLKNKVLYNRNIQDKTYLTLEI